MTPIYELQKLRMLALDTSNYLSSRTDRLETMQHFSDVLHSGKAKDAPQVMLGALAILSLNAEVVLNDMRWNKLVRYNAEQRRRVQIRGDE